MQYSVLASPAHAKTAGYGLGVFDGDGIAESFGLV
jgi:hypothetical protein